MADHDAPPTTVDNGDDATTQPATTFETIALELRAHICEYLFPDTLDLLSTLRQGPNICPKYSSPQPSVEARLERRGSNHDWTAVTRLSQVSRKMRGTVYFAWEEVAKEVVVKIDLTTQLQRDWSVLPPLSPFPSPPSLAWPLHNIQTLTISEIYVFSIGLPQRPLGRETVTERLSINFKRAADGQWTVNDGASWTHHRDDTSQRRTQDAGAQMLVEQGKAIMVQTIVRSALRQLEDRPLTVDAIYWLQRRFRHFFLDNHPAIATALVCIGPVSDEEKMRKGDVEQEWEVVGLNRKRQRKGNAAHF